MLRHLLLFLLLCHSSSCYEQLQVYCESDAACLSTNKINTESDMNFICLHHKSNVERESTSFSNYDMDCVLVLKAQMKGLATLVSRASALYLYLSDMGIMFLFQCSTSGMKSKCCSFGHCELFNYNKPSC